MNKKRTVTKRALITAISEDRGIDPNDVRIIIQAFINKVADSLYEGNRLEFRDFGVFEVVRRKKKVGRNPKNAKVSIAIPERNVVKFSQGKKMCARLNNEDDY